MLDVTASATLFFCRADQGRAEYHTVCVWGRGDREERDGGGEQKDTKNGRESIRRWRGNSTKHTYR
jgi:hypothetical protein